MSTACGRPQGGGGPAHVDACGHGEGVSKTRFFVDVINGWPLIVIVNSRFLQRPQKRSRGNQLIHSRLSKTKLIGSESEPERQASRQSDTISAVQRGCDSPGHPAWRASKNPVFVFKKCR